MGDFSCTLLFLTQGAFISFNSLPQMGTKYERVPRSCCMKTVNEAISTSLTSVSQLGVMTLDSVTRGDRFSSRIGRDSSVSKSNRLGYML